MSKPKGKDKIIDVQRKKTIIHYDKIPPFDTAYNDTIGKSDSKERT
ncbi:hypothetical protein [Desulfitobacterium metallireducens]|uniref:Uncharacterized protein n=1 Tax=Desulfitobacterium metallireducens DSM 15288 TaxID=871968 RepID=W0ECB0_9FIRM|nr:hypothetical protein [Desulfitobacterium metallireducens]AHF06844.1 hypothetical protein DESME_07040 [Desulfitobacterium metallireducens DSM 15288]